LLDRLLPTKKWETTFCLWNPYYMCQRPCSLSELTVVWSLKIQVYVPVCLESLNICENDIGFGCYIYIGLASEGTSNNCERNNWSFRYTVKVVCIAILWIWHILPIKGEFLYIVFYLLIYNYSYFFIVPTLLSKVVKFHGPYLDKWVAGNMNLLFFFFPFLCYPCTFMPH
jgi:hypothetical protein